MAGRKRVGKKAKLKMVHGAVHSMHKKGKHKGGRRKRSHKK